MSLRNRCREFLTEQKHNAMLRVGSPVDDLLAFVLAETGRASDLSLADTLPLILYFASEEDRDA